MTSLFLSYFVKEVLLSSLYKNKRNSWDKNLGASGEQINNFLSKFSLDSHDILTLKNFKM